MSSHFGLISNKNEKKVVCQEALFYKPFVFNKSHLLYIDVYEITDNSLLSDQNNTKIKERRPNSSHKS